MQCLLKELYIKKNVFYKNLTFDLWLLIFFKFNPSIWKKISLLFQRHTTKVDTHTHALTPNAPHKNKHTDTVWPLSHLWTTGTLNASPNCLDPENGNFGTLTVTLAMIAISTGVAVYSSTDKVTAIPYPPYEARR